MIPAHMYMDALVDLLRPIAPLLADASVSEILVNGAQHIFVERAGRLERTPARFEDREAVLCALRAIAQYSGQLIDERSPVLEARLPDGSRVEAILDPIAADGPALAIRRFSRATLSLSSLVELDALPADAAQLLSALTAARCNILVAGGTGSGKTTLLNVLGAAVPATERMLVIEDTRELAIPHEHVVYLQTRKPDEDGFGTVTMRDLFRASLRMRPDRIVIGEMRGAEALDLVQAMVSGHGGGLATLHATYPRDTIMRLETMCMMSDVELPLPAIRMQIGSGIDVLVQVARQQDGSRKLTHITELAGYDVATGKYDLVDLYTRGYRGGGRLDSALTPTGALPSFQPRLQAYAVELPDAMLRAAHCRSGSP